MTDEIHVITNHIPRPVLYWWNLTDKERTDFDYLDTEPKREEATFVRYKGSAYDLGDTEGPWGGGQTIFPGWDMYVSETFFSGVLFRYPRDWNGNLDSDFVICGRYYS